MIRIAAVDDDGSTALPCLANGRSNPDTRVWTCSPVSGFRIVRRPDNVQIRFGGGYSGRGTFAPTIGEILADLCVDRKARHDIAYLSSTRPVRVEG